MGKYTPVMHATASTIEELTPRQAKLYLLLLAAPQKTMLGVMGLRIRTIAAQVGTRTDAVEKDLDALAKIGLITRCTSGTHLRVIADSSAGNRWNFDLITSESSALSSLDDQCDGRCDAVAEALEILDTKGNKKPSRGEKKRATNGERHITTLHDKTNTPTPPEGAKKKRSKKPSLAERPPTREEVVEAFLANEKCPDSIAASEAEHFMAYHEQYGWTGKRGPLRSLAGCVATWVGNDYGKRIAAATKPAFDDTYGGWV